MIGAAMSERRVSKQVRAKGRARSPGRRGARRSPPGSVFRLLFVDLLARYRSERRLPPLDPIRVARMSDEALFAEVRAARGRASPGTRAEKPEEKEPTARSETAPRRRR
ncbi:MAG: hypothetical protein F9K40_01550 [Kofleriaceae bacterium]|nr:MAG: hypothetical protein F9K40_01550 [Kofleriaceae bacterium]